MSLTSDSRFNTRTEYFVQKKQPTNVLLDAGIIIGYGRLGVPAGWTICDGKVLSATTYPDLFAKIGYTFGGSGDNFNVPDLRMKVPIGLGAPFSTLGATGGAETVTLTVSNLPAHTHQVIDPGHQHLMRSQNNDGIAGLSTFCSYNNSNQLTVQTATTGISIQNTGGSGVITTSQSYITINQMIKLTNAGIIVP
jgi:microcystin-dependent protein